MSKKTIVQAIVCIGLVVMIWGGYFFAKNRIDRIIEVKDDDFSWVYQVDSVEVTEDNEFVLRGFAFEIKNDAIEGAFEIVLQDIESGKNYFPKMKYMERKDVNKYFLCEYDYLYSGFEATIKAKKIRLEDRQYEILLRMTDGRETYRTGTYISNGKLMYAKPTEFASLEVNGTDLEKVVGQGVLRVYRPDYGMYVYQYEGELYWIAEAGYEFDEDGNTYVQWHLETTQKEKLPKERLENQWFFDNLGFDFSDMELSEVSGGKYRVAKKALPKEYSIIQMNTGMHVEEWIWKQDFRPYYEFK